MTAPIETCEVDFILVSEKSYDDKVQLAIGECKGKGEISQERTLDFPTRLPNPALRATRVYYERGPDPQHVQRTDGFAPCPSQAP